VLKYAGKTGNSEYVNIVFVT